MNEKETAGTDPAIAAGTAGTLIELLTTPPTTHEPPSPEPAKRAREIAKAAARKAGIAAASLALPPGPAGWFTIVPELMAIWRIQAQMVADIAGAYGRDASLTREHMLYCLFRHTAAQAMRDLAVRVGERALVGGFGLRIAQRSLSRGLARVIPVAGALGVGAYAFYDTGQVGKAAVALFEAD